MKSSSHSSLFLILVFSIVLLLSLQLLASPSGEVEAEIEKVSGKDNVDGGEPNIAMLTKLRMLFGLHGSSSASQHIRASQLSPAQAPIEEVAEILSPLPSLHKLHIYHIAPSKNPRKPPVVHGTEEHLSVQRKHSQMIVAISVSILATLAIFGVMAVAVLVYRRRRRNAGHCNISNKVSFDPEPDMFYFDSLAPFLESDSDHKLSSELKSVMSVEKNVTSSLQSEGLTHHSFLDSENHLEEATNNIDSLSSDGSDSFHSICCSHCSIESKCSLVEPSLDCSLANGNLHLLTSSKLNVFSTKSIEKPVSSTNLIPFNIRKASLHPLVPESLESKPSQFSNTLNNEDNMLPLLTSQSSSNPQMVPAGSWPFSKDTESSNLIAKIPSESRNQAIRADLASSMPITVDIMNSAKQLQTVQSIKGQQIPNPSNCNGSIPKPPPPPPRPLPPSFQRSSNIGKPAPPPPFQQQQSSAVDKDGNPLPKLKPLHWDKVRAAPDRSMVWDKIRSSSFVLDEKTIESLFGYNMHCSVKNEESKRKNSSPSKQVLEHKRLQNFTIIMKALNATAEQVCNALILGSGLGTQQLEALTKMVPTKEEEERIYKYEGDIDELGSTETFLKVILSIPLAFSRIGVMLYKETFDDEVIHLKKSFAILEEACKELRSSRLFLRLLDAVLKTGNRMNVGTIRGGARAFKLDALLKLADVKGTDGKTTLLHFVVQEMNKSEGLNTHEKNNEKAFTKGKAKTTKEKEEDYNAREQEIVSSLSSELCNVKKTATMDLDVLASSISNLSNGMCKLKELLEELTRNQRDVSFVSSMRSFQKQGEGIINELKESEDRVFRHVREITEYYHGDVSKDEVNPLRIFVIVSDFLGMLDRVCKELRSSKSPQTLNLAVSLARVLQRFIVWLEIYRQRAERYNAPNLGTAALLIKLEIESGALRRSKPGFVALRARLHP
ncbi:formin-like protein 2 [Dendrobium catenatum]|uniref:formin-like protein 2 n=1 Tax=Dendrobium catenatum TaxID=906689 RepID=UPI0010A08D1F|nr:formin-like protein 2 [Dendrobium catenatum]